MLELLLAETQMMVRGFSAAKPKDRGKPLDGAGFGCLSWRVGEDWANARVIPNGSR